MVDDLIRSFLNLHPDTPIDGQEYAVPLRVVKRLLEAGMKVEREACAKVCEAVEVPDVIYGAHPDYLEGKLMAISQAATAIRARGQG